MAIKNNKCLNFINELKKGNHYVNSQKSYPLARKHFANFIQNSHLNFRNNTQLEKKI